jgi:D-sedoheptulose 7-phosphate isomerase
MHIANDLISCGVKAQALTGDIATLTATANDFCYEDAFAIPLRTLGSADDLLIALSGSGRSPNILRAIAAAKDIGMKSFAIVGEFNQDCPAANVADDCLKWGKDMQDAEEKQLYLGHKAMRWLKNS